MPNFTEDNGPDHCDCTYGTACAYHKQKQEESRAQWEALCEEKGWDPDGEVTDAALSELLGSAGDPNMSDRQRDALWRKHFPRRKR